MIIFSAVRSHVEHDESQDIGFLSDPKRVNVLLTRAKQCLIIVGNARHFNANGGIWADIVQFYNRKNALFGGERIEVLKHVVIQ